ncbi:MAG: tRNA (adenosine(37)-N6)-dimethylallyltransferase MiaA [Candidatus Dormibacteraeota bacterium]|uniref:tRNA dimethylallyltransferase n=1 Tax=Candidatus Amunia macphersoniae TaxID=3127014 RepID=A0A934NJM2_9BACT|nr:tRNA (adenosine(37)-N6)-dimethylallyltransferase MiaA [Candidatus Dormibacteraeota bacterium]
MSAPPPPLAIVGPTATGKTVLGVELARRIGAELVNADSRQVIRRLRVGTAAPTPAELRGVRCHLLDLCEPGEPFSVADWLGHARAALSDLGGRGVPAILVGGTGQYLRALREGWDFDGLAPDETEREGLTATASSAEGLEALAAELTARDPGGAAGLDLANPRRVVRALELLRSGATSLAQARRSQGGVPVRVVVLDAQRALHGEGLAARVDGMFASGGLVAEVEDELRRGTTPAALQRAGIGYTEALELIGGRRDVASARARALQRTQRYVKAQRTWFRHEPATRSIERGPHTSTDDLAEVLLSAVRCSAAAPG